MPRHLNTAIPSVLLSSISKVMPKKSLIIRRHYTVKGDTLPILAELVFFSLRAINVSRNHWQLVDTAPQYLISSMNLSRVFFTNYSVFSPSQAASKVRIDPVVVSALRLRLYPGDLEPLSPLQQSVYIHMSGRYSRKAVLTWSFTSLSILVAILLPAQTPLTRLMYPFSSTLIRLSFLIAGTDTCTSPPPSGRYPLLMIFTDSSLSNQQCSFNNGTRC